MITPTPETLVIIKFALAVGLSAVGLGAWLRHQELAPRRWLQVNGTIVASRIEKKYASRGGYQFVPMIEYEYSYNEQTFKSSRRRAGNYISGKRKYADAVISHYPVGSSVTVFINPQKPATSALEYGITPMSWIPLGLGLFFTALALLPFFVN